MNVSKSLGKSSLLAVRNFTKTKPLSFPWQKAKDKILGKKYELSLVFVGDRRSRTLNRLHRGKDKSANVLSFPLSKTTGEIFLNPHRGASWGLGFLFIHGLLHLKGLDHGSRMEVAEKKYARQFNCWPGHWHRFHQGRGVRKP